MNRRLRASGFGLQAGAIAVALALVLSVRPRASAAADPPELRSIQELKTWFNAFKGRPRLILLLSPT